MSAVMVADLIQGAARGIRFPNYRRYWLALYRRDVASAERIVEWALGRWRAPVIYLRLFEPALRLSGTLWARGAIRVIDEHFITYHTVRLIRRVRRQFVPEQTTGPLALATGVAQESHLIGLRMVCDFLRSENWRVAWLPSTDRATVAEHVQRLRPQAVLLSLGQDKGIQPAQRLITDLHRRDYRGLTIVGGRIVTQRPELVTDLGADLSAPNGLMLVRALRKRSVDR